MKKSFKVISIHIHDGKQIKYIASEDEIFVPKKRRASRGKVAKAHRNNNSR